MKKQKNKNSVTIAIIAALLIVVITGGSTYAYWMWTSNTAQQTNVAFNVAAVGLYANLEGNGTVTASSLAPAACTNSTDAIKKPVTIKYKNETSQAATVSASLKIATFTIRSATYQPTSSQLAKLKWAVTTNNSSCTTNLVSSGSFPAMTFASSATTPTGLTASSPINLGNFTFQIPANTVTEQANTYYLYVWLDSTYSPDAGQINEGSTIKDPMQGLNFTLQWSGSVSQNAS